MIVGNNGSILGVSRQSNRQQGLDLLRNYDEVYRLRDWNYDKAYREGWSVKKLMNSDVEATIFADCEPRARSAK